MHVSLDLAEIELSREEIVQAIKNIDETRMSSRDLEILQVHTAVRAVLLLLLFLLKSKLKLLLMLMLMLMLVFVRRQRVLCPCSVFLPAREVMVSFGRALSLPPGERAFCMARYK